MPKVSIPHQSKISGSRIVNGGSIYRGYRGNQGYRGNRGFRILRNRERDDCDPFYRSRTSDYP